jgi:hypothetical protein
MAARRITINLSQVGARRELEEALLTPAAERTPAEIALVAKADPTLAERMERLHDTFEKFRLTREAAIRTDAGLGLAEASRRHAHEWEERHGGEIAILGVLREIRAELHEVSSRQAKHDEQLRTHEAELVRLRSGAPGRPSAMHLVRDEFERRVASGQLEETVTEQSEALADWLRTSHSTAAPLTPKAIRNRLAMSFRAAKARTTSAPARRGGRRPR